MTQMLNCKVFYFFWLSTIVIGTKVPTEKELSSGVVRLPAEH